MSELAHLKMAVCNYYQLARVDGNQFSKEHKKLIREKISVPREHMEFINSQWYQSGKLYIEDEQASFAYAEKIKSETDQRKSDEADTKTATEALTKILADTKKGKKQKDQESE